MTMTRNGNTARDELYTPEQRARRDATRWTLVQGVLAPLQFLVFAISVACIAHYLVTGEGYWGATLSILVKTGVLYTIMVTGAIWEKVVFGRFLFAPAFFWEDVVSMGVIALHTAYVVILVMGDFGPILELSVASTAYLAYLVNAAQFLIKFSMGRADRNPQSDPRAAGLGAS